MVKRRRSREEGSTSINQSSRVSVSSLHVCGRSFSRRSSSGTYSVVRRHYQPSSTWSGPVEITPAYRDVETVVVCVSDVSSLCCETQRSTMPKERTGEWRRKGGRGREPSRRRGRRGEPRELAEG